MCISWPCYPQEAKISLIIFRRVISSIISCCYCLGFICYCCWCCCCLCSSCLSYFCLSFCCLFMCCFSASLSSTIITVASFIYCLLKVISAVFGIILLMQKSISFLTSFIAMFILTSLSNISLSIYSIFILFII